METDTLTRHDRRLANREIQGALERLGERDLAVTNSPDYFEIDGVDAHLQAVNWEAGSCNPDTVSHPACQVSADDPDSHGSGLCAAAARPTVLGNIDVPAEGSRWDGESSEVSGWALSSGGIRALHVKRDPMPADLASAIGRDGLVELGLARFHNATRADVMRPPRGLQARRCSETEAAWWARRSADRRVPEALRLRLCRCAWVCVPVPGLSHRRGVRVTSESVARRGVGGPTALGTSA